MTLNSSEVTFAEDEAERKWCGMMTASRRTFCLLVTFDLILTFILWGVYAKVSYYNVSVFLLYDFDFSLCAY